MNSTINFFPAYSRGGGFDRTSLWGVPDICRSCGAWRCARCAYNDSQEGPRRCRRGLSLYITESRVYYGLRIEGYYNKSIQATCGFSSEGLSEDEVKAFVMLESKVGEMRRVVSDLADREGCYAKCLQRIWKPLYLMSETSDRDGVVSISDKDSDQVECALSDLQTVKVVFKELKAISDVVRKSLSRFVRSGVTTSAVSNELTAIVDCADNLRAWLHDEGQYISGLQGLISLMSRDRNSCPLHRIHSICSITYALNLLRNHYFSPSDALKCVPIYKLFDRYRYCMMTSDVEWKLWRENNERFDERIYAAAGFEFVVSNLFDNAVKNLPPDHAFRWVKTTFKHEKDLVVIEVRSFGPPRTVEEVTQIGLKRNFRCNEELNQRYGVLGSGMGAYRIKELIDKSGFNIWYESGGATILSRGLPYREFVVHIEIPNESIVKDEFCEDYDDAF